MKLIGWRTIPYSIPYHSGASSLFRGVSRRDGLILMTLAKNGLTGLGEIAPLPGHSTETLAQAREQARVLSRELIDREIPGSPSELETVIAQIAGSGTFPSVVFGFETAIADLASRATGLTLANWLTPTAHPAVPVNALLAGSPDAIEQEIGRIRLLGYRAYKIKVGRGRMEADVEVVARVRGLLGDTAVIRIDVNREWSFDQAIEALSRLRDYGISYVEEPLAGSQLHRIPELYESCGIPIALDETVSDMEKFESLIKEEAIRAIIIKPSVVGGLTRSLILSRRMSDMGKESVVSSLFESGVGLAACLHLAAALGGQAPPPCGLDTLRYLENTLITGDLPVRDGCMAIPDGPGLGVNLSAAFQE